MTLCSRWKGSDVEVTDSWAGHGMNGGSMAHINRQLRAVGGGGGCVRVCVSVCVSATPS